MPANTSKEGSNQIIPVNGTNADKGPLPDHPKDVRGVPLDPFPPHQQAPIKCYQCQGLGHKSNNCPKWREVRMYDHQSEESQTEGNKAEIYEKEAS